MFQFISEFNYNQKKIAWKYLERKFATDIVIPLLTSHHGDSYVHLRMSWKGFVDKEWSYFHMRGYANDVLATISFESILGDQFVLVKEDGRCIVSCKFKFWKMVL